jgi:glycosyltransferase involved in cell wall biosynthesis
MKIQVLVATMHQNDNSLLGKMNIQTDAIICNQCDRYGFKEFSYRERSIRWFSFRERGVGLNRNNALMRATEDIVLFADDDVVYYDGYEKIITDYYESHPDADMVIFNFKMRRGDIDFYERVTKEGRVGKKRATKYGAYCISARRERLRFANVYFHQDFGGGTKYSCGEDTLFLQDCLGKRLRIYASKDTIGVLDHGASTWFSGYNDKFFFDKGVLFYCLDRRLCRVLSVYHCFKHRRRYHAYGWRRALRQMQNGIRHAKQMN